MGEIGAYSVTAASVCLQVNLNSASRSQSSHAYDDSTLPLIDRNQRSGTEPRTSVSAPPLPFSSGPAV